MYIFSLSLSLTKMNVRTNADFLMTSDEFRISFLPFLGGEFTLGEPASPSLAFARSNRHLGH
jgi:hypothetical protein